MSTNIVSGGSMTSERTEVITRTEHERVVHKTQLVNVSVSSTTVAVQGHSFGSPTDRNEVQRRSITLISSSSLSPRSPSGLSIEPIELGTPFTAEQMDEKRENRRVYDYLCRLLEVRNWLVECLQTSDIPEEIHLEQNLSNGVLLARLANFFAPHMVPLNKIFDLNQSRYTKDGKPCYRHTDNIMMWRRAVRAIRLPEVLIPETVDIYEGHNINTIFCLYALALHLFRLRRGPPIRNQAGNAQFPVSVMEEMHERLKDSSIPAFGQLGDILDTTSPTDKDAHSIAIQELNKAIDTKDDFLNRLKHPDAGILYVNDRLVNNYQALLKETKNLKPSGENLDREQIQKVITKVNQTDALRRLEILFANKGTNADDTNEMTAILDDLQQEGVMQYAIPVYEELLYKTREAQQQPLSVKQIDEIVDAVNACVRVKLATLGNDADGLYEVLSTPELHCADNLNEELKPFYLEHLKHEYQNQDKNFILFPERIQTIVNDVSSINPQQIKVYTVQDAIRRDDKQALIESLKDIHEAKPEFITYYMIILKTITTYTTIEEIEEIIRTINLSILRAEQRGRKAVDVNRLLLEGKRNEAKQALENAFNDIIITDLLSNYIIRLEEEIMTRRRLLGKDQSSQASATAAADHIGTLELDKGELGYLPEHFEAGELYLNMDDNSIAVEHPKPEQINEWLLRSQDIEGIIKKENDKAKSAAEKHREEDDILANRKRREEAARKIQQAWRRYRIRRDFNELRNSPNPSLRVVRTFIKTLVNTKEDAEEEAEIEDNKSRITKLNNTNRHLDEHLQDLDKRIALLVKNRINLQELIEHGNKISKEAKDEDLIGTAPEHAHEYNERPFEMICYHLQTEPQHLVRLIVNYYSKPEELSEFFKKALLPLFNYVADEREEFLFASLIRAILKHDIESLQQPESLRKTHAALVTQLLIPMVISMNQMRPKIIEICKELRLKENQIDSFNLNAEAIYEVYEGSKPKTIKEAVENDKVAHVLNQSKTFLSKWGIRFAEVLFDKTNRPPKMLRYLVNSVFIDMKEHFPRATDSDIMQGIGGWIYKCFWEQMITAEIKYDDGSADDDQNKRKAISRFVEYGVINVGYGADKWYLSTLNESITRINEIAKQLLNPLIAEEEEIYHQHRYVDITGNRKPLLHISLQQLNSIHQYSMNNINEMFANANDPLRVLIERTQAFKLDQNLYVTLLLHPMPIADHPEKDPQELFQRTKRHLIECLLCGCPGENVSILLANPTLEREEQKYRELPHSEENQMSLNEKKHQIMNDLNELEKEGLVQKNNHYQAIVNAIAKDINREREYRSERRENLSNLRKMVTQLEENRKEYNERLAAYQKYLEQCLDNISLTAK